MRLTAAAGRGGGQRAAAACPARAKGGGPSAEGTHRLALAIRAAVGIEPLVWLTDVGGLSRDEATELMRSSARALLRAAMDDDG